MSDVYQYECVRLDIDFYSLRFFKKENILTLSFFDELDDDEVEVTIWDETGFHLDECPIKDVEFLNSKLLYMRSSI